MTPTNAVTEEVQKRKKRKRGVVENSQKTHESTVTSSLDNNETQPSIPTNVLDKLKMKRKFRKKPQKSKKKKRKKNRKSTNVTFSNPEPSAHDNGINPSKPSLHNEETKPSKPLTFLEKGAMSKVAARKKARWTSDQRKTKRRESTNVTSSNSELSSDNNEINPSKTLGFLEKGHISGAAATEEPQKSKKKKRKKNRKSTNVTFSNPEPSAHDNGINPSKPSLHNEETKPSKPLTFLEKGAMSKVAARKKARWTSDQRKTKRRESTNVTSSNSEHSSDNNEINPSKTLGFLEKGHISGAAATEEPQKSKKKKKRKKNRKSTNVTFSNPEPSAHDNGINPSKPSLHNEETKPSKPLTFLEKMKARLSAGHFRMLNERLYTCTGTEALNYFKENPELFNKYHEGYQEQMSHWPELPVNSVVKWLKDRDSSLVVADFGCGDARLAKNVKNKVYSIDLVASDPSVIACDMSKTPLDSSSVDVAVFCLSLMGTDFPSYLLEAHRVLKPSGWLLIAEVKSRFDTNTGGADPDKFERAICQLGFSTSAKDFSNKMFIMLYFKKKDEPTSQKEIEWPELKPCLYKRR